MKNFNRKSLLGTLFIILCLFGSIGMWAQSTQIKEQKIEITIEKKDAKGNSSIKKIIKNDGNYTSVEIDKMVADLSKENPGATVKVNVEETERTINAPQTTTRKIIIDKREKGEKGDKDQDVEISINGENIQLNDSSRVMLFRDDESGSWLDKSPMDIFKTLEGDSLVAELRKLESRLNNGYSRMLNPKPFMGIEPGENNVEGVEIGGIVKNSPAEMAGLKDGDIILSLDAVAVKTFDDVKNIVSERKPGDMITVNFKRGGLVDSKKLTLASKKSDFTYSDDADNEYRNSSPRDMENEIRIERVEPNNSDRRGLQIQPFNFRSMNDGKVQLGVEITNANKGVMVSKVMDGSAAYYIGLKNGDIITKIDNKIIRNPNDLINEVSSHNQGDEVKITFLRNCKRKTATARLGSSGNSFRFGSSKGTDSFHTSLVCN